MKIRHCYRTVINDEEFAKWMYERIKSFVPKEYIDENMRKWIVQRINPNLRNCKYEAGNYFGSHIFLIHYLLLFFIILLFVITIYYF